MTSWELSGPDKAIDVSNEIHNNNKCTCTAWVHGKWGRETLFQSGLCH